MELALNIFATIALLLLVLLTIVSLFSNQKYKKREVYNRIKISDPSKEALISIFNAKKTFREALRIVFENYREGLSNLNSAPDEAEFFSQQILFAIYNLHSNNQNEVMSSLQSLAALGTQDLSAILDEDIAILETKWKYNARVIRMIQLTKQMMSERLENKHKVTLMAVSDNAENRSKEEQRTSIEVSY